MIAAPTSARAAAARSRSASVTLVSATAPWRTPTSSRIGGAPRTAVSSPRSPPRRTGASTADPGQHVGDEADVTGHVHEREHPTRWQGSGREPEVDGEAALLLLLQPVRIRAGERPHDGRLAVIDMTGGGHHLRGGGFGRRRHCPVARTASARGPSSARSTVRRSGTVRPSCTRPRTEECGPNEQVRSPVIARPTDGISMPGRFRPRARRACPPPPHRRWPRLVLAARRPVPWPCATAAGRWRGGRGRRGRSLAGHRAPANRGAAPGRWALQRSTRSVRPAITPACGPPSSLSPEKVTTPAPSSRVWRAEAQRGPPAGHLEPRASPVEQPGAEIDG